jgi:hypothetical protein
MMILGAIIILILLFGTVWFCYWLSEVIPYFERNDLFMPLCVVAYVLELAIILQLFHSFHGL